MWRSIALFLALQAGLAENASAQSPSRLLVVPAFVCGNEPSWAAAQQLLERVWHAIDTSAYRRIELNDVRMVEEVGPCGGARDSLAIADGDMLALGQLFRASVLLSVRVLHPASGWFVEVGTFLPQQRETRRHFDATSKRSYGEALDEVVPRVLEYLRARGVPGFQSRPS
jgi:hypothetical protein